MFPGVQTFPYTERKSGSCNRFGSRNASVCVILCPMHVHRTRSMAGKKEREKSGLAEDLGGAIWLWKDRILVSYCTHQNE